MSILDIKKGDIKVQSTVQPDTPMDFNQWCRTLNVSASYDGGMRGEGIIRASRIMADIAYSRAVTGMNR
jgi:hypothetical protein